MKEIWEIKDLNQIMKGNRCPANGWVAFLLGSVLHSVLCIMTLPGVFIKLKIPDLSPVFLMP